MNRIGSQPNRIAAVALATLLAIAGIATVVAQALGPAGPSPAGDNAAVVAQALVTLPAGDTVWRIRNLQVAEADSTLNDTYPAFLTTEGVPVLVTDTVSGLRQRVAAGEATVLAPGHDIAVRSMGPRQTVLALDVLPVADASLTGSPGSISLPFTVEAGSYDVDLIRIDLEEGESSTVPMGNGPTQLIARTGQAEIAAEETFNIAAGSDRLAEGDLTITALADDTVILAARIGPRVELEGATPEEPEPEATPAPATPAPATPEPSTPVAEEPPQDIDTDGDGIVNSEEIAIGTDPANPDTDGDGLTDGEELLAGTDPLVADTDEDGVPDGQELAEGTDPLNLDTDGDQLYDGGEALYLTDPLNPDTDGDGISDGNEVYVYETDPTNPDTDGDGINDFNDPDTITGGGTGALALRGDDDIDNDGLANAAEARNGTDLLAWDSDGDGVRDGEAA